MADFIPVNRHILIELPPTVVEQEGNNYGILLPDDYEPVLSAHVAVKVLDWAEDTSLSLEEDQTAVVQRAMVEEIEIGEHVFHIILENYVFGLIEE